MDIEAIAKFLLESIFNQPRSYFEHPTIADPGQEWSARVDDGDSRIVEERKMLSLRKRGE